MVKYSPANGRDKADPGLGRILTAVGQLLKPSHLAPVLHTGKALHSSKICSTAVQKKKSMQHRS